MKRYALPLLLIPFCAIANDEKIAYTCADGSSNGSRIDISFLADMSGRPQATLHFADEAITLPQVPAASGALYRSGEIRLHTKGDDAIIEDGKGNLRRCLLGDKPPATSQAAPQTAAASSFIDINGTVSYLSRIALPPGAILSVRIQAGKRTLVEQSYELNGAQVPIPFSATVDRDLIGKKARLTIAAKISVGGKVRFLSEQVTPAMQNGLPQAVEILLKPAHVKAR